MKKGVKMINSINTKLEGNNFDLPQTGTINNRKAVVIDPSHAKRNNFGAGVGPGMFDFVVKGIAVAAVLFATAVAALAVGIATAYAAPVVTFAVIAKPVGITLAIGIVAAVITSFLVK